jgi:hypothetical protein
MNKRLFALALVLCLVLLAMMATPHKVKACSGGDCGCYSNETECEAECNGNIYCINLGLVRCQ